jgi:hypothetical protein
MADRLDEQYVDDTLAWDEWFIATVSRSINDITAAVKGSTGQLLYDSIYEVLDNAGYYDTAVDRIYNSITASSPDFTREKFFRQYREVIDNIDYDAAVRRVKNTTEQGKRILNSRIDRLRSLRDIEDYTDKISTVERINKTRLTRARQIRDRISQKKTVMSRFGVTPEQKEILQSEVDRLQEQLDTVTRKNAEISRRLKRARAGNINRRGWQSLIDELADDIGTNQYRAMVEEAYRNGAKYPVDRTAKTEYTRWRGRADKAAALRSGNRLRWTLSAAHAVSCVCEDFAGKIYEASTAPVPVDDSHPNCACRLVPVE